MDTMNDYIRRLLGAKLGPMIPGGKGSGSIVEAAKGAEALRKKVVKKKKGGVVNKGSRVR
tara:strand:- start:1492 stop:1671 length:180 start_codon:yes stop_codon:yes gene_type:complete